MTLHYLLHFAVGGLLVAAGRCRRPAPFIAYVAAAGAGAGLLHAQHHPKERA